nr:MAG TPA: holin [Caudoviricetes sp.]
MVLLIRGSQGLRKGVIEMKNYIIKWAKAAGIRALKTVAQTAIMAMQRKWRLNSSSAIGDWTRTANMAQKPTLC